MKFCFGWFFLHPRAERHLGALQSRAREITRRLPAQDPRSPTPWLARMLLPHAASAVNATAAFPIFTLLAVGHASTGIDLLVRTERDRCPSYWSF